MTSNTLYVTQTVILCFVLFVLLFRHGAVLRLQLFGWAVLTAMVALRYGIEGQTFFYSNDQQYYTNVVKSILESGIPFDMDWWLTASRWPLTLPAALLGYVGIAPVLALKTVSLLYLCALTIHVQRIYLLDTHERLIHVTYFAGLGAIGVAFSSLALRETSLMFYVVIFLTSRSAARRFIALLLLLFLRSHLAVALLIGNLVFSLFGESETQKPWTRLQAVLTTIGGVAFGWLLFSFGVALQTKRFVFLGSEFGLGQSWRILSNYVGLQFLTVAPETRETGLFSLILFRLAFSETIVCLCLFTGIAFAGRRFSTLGRTTLLSFSIYVGLAVNTEFNSFRQNLPFLPLMGIVVSEHWKTRRRERSIITCPSETSG